MATVSARVSLQKQNHYYICSIYDICLHMYVMGVLHIYVCANIYVSILYAYVCRHIYTEREQETERERKQSIDSLDKPEIRKREDHQKRGG